MSFLRRHRTLVVASAPVAVLALVVGLWAFQPWKVLTSNSINEALPTIGAEQGDVEPGAAEPGAAGQAEQPPSAAGDVRPPAVQPSPGQPTAAKPPAALPPPAQPALVVLAEGGFVSQEHATSGGAKLVRLQDGSRYLRLENFATSDGPDVHVWLTDQPAGLQDWHVYDDGRYVRLGKIKATHGNQNYPIPADADLAGLRSVVIWCDRFNVAFGSAALVA